MRRRAVPGALLAALVALGAAPARAEEATHFEPPRAEPARSPLPEAGEKRARPVAYERLPGLGIGPGRRAQALPWRAAREHVGETRVVEGVIADAHPTSGVCFLNFSEDWRGKFYVLLLGYIAETVPGGPEAYYEGRRVRVIGPIGTHEGRPQIVVKRGAQIGIVLEPRGSE